MSTLRLGDIPDGIDNVIHSNMDLKLFAYIAGSDLLNDVIERVLERAIERTKSKPLSQKLSDAIWETVSDESWVHDA